MSALISGIIVSLADRYETEADETIWRHQRQQQSQNSCRECHCTAKCMLESDSQREEVQKRSMRRAVWAADGVIRDLRDLMELGDVSVLVLNLLA